MTMLPYLRWLFTAKKDRAVYLLDCFNNYIAGDKRIEPVLGRLTVATTADEFRITISNDKYSAEQLWKARCTNTINIYTPTMDYPNSKLYNKLITIILEKVAEIDTAVDMLSKYHHRLFDNENFSMTSFCDESKIYESVTICPGGVLPLITATEQDIKTQERYEIIEGRKADLDAYYQYIIGAFKDYLDGSTPHCFSPYIDIMSFESWLDYRPAIEKDKRIEAETSKKCARVLDDIKGISNMGGGASCAAS
jgi:hypothetical protein